MLLVNKLCYFSSKTRVRVFSESYQLLLWLSLMEWLESFCWETCDLQGVFPRSVRSSEKQKQYKLPVCSRYCRFLYGHVNFSPSGTFSSRSKSSPENETKLSLFRFAPAVESSTHFFSLMPIDPCKNWKKNKQRYSHFAFDNPRHVYGFLLHETSTQRAR